jgi:Trypsin-like peptidase domain
VLADAARPAIPADFKPVRVGDGHGFIVEGKRRYVITAAHCLPELPPAHPASYLHERTYRALLAPFGAAACSVWAECLFVDPVNDIAVLGSPDGQALWDEAELYEAMTEAGITLKVSDPPRQYWVQKPYKLGGKTYRERPMPVPTECRAWLFSIAAGRWFDCVARSIGGGFEIVSAAEDIIGGMSGTPIVVDDGSAIGVVSTSSWGPRLAGDLPGRILLELGIWRRRR